MHVKEKRKGLRASKATDMLVLIRDAVQHGRCRDSRHSFQRGKERSVTFAEVMHVLQTGCHEKSKDEYRPEFESWNYAIRGRTVDGDELRIAVYFEEDLVVIATVIRLEK